MFVFFITMCIISKCEDEISSDSSDSEENYNDVTTNRNDCDKNDVDVIVNRYD